MKRTPIILNGQNLDLHQAVNIALGAPLQIATFSDRFYESRQLVEKLAESAKPIYGVNTGFGYFAKHKIGPAELEKLQSNLIKSHAGGYGQPLSLQETRLAMALRLNVLLKGYTGVTKKLCDTLLNHIQAGIYPVIPSYGSVGASGDLIPLAHLALPLIGEGDVYYKGKITTASQALKAAGIKPIKFSTKEGLGLINGTQIMLSVGTLALASSKTLGYLANLVAALTYEAMTSCTAPLDLKIHAIRGQKGQITSAEMMRGFLKGSYLHSEKIQKRHVQDPYSLRCAPQIHGASLDAFDYTEKIVNIELNAATDNPLVFATEHEILSGGNFHGQPLALAFDFCGIGVSELGNVSDRRLETLMNPNISGLPAFLTPKEGINSGYMVLQYLSASLANENKVLANPASTDSIPGNVGIEDHVSMGMTSARKLKKIVQNTTTILSLEALAAAQAIDLKKITKLGKATKQLYTAIRAEIPPLKDDRIVSNDVEKVVAVIQNYIEEIA